MPPVGLFGSSSARKDFTTLVNDWLVESKAVTYRPHAFHWTHSATGKDYEVPNEILDKVVKDIVDGWIADGHRDVKDLYYHDKTTAQWRTEIKNRADHMLADWLVYHSGEKAIIKNYFTTQLSQLLEQHQIITYHDDGYHWIHAATGKDYELPKGMMAQVLTSVVDKWIKKGRDMDKLLEKQTKAQLVDETKRRVDEMLVGLLVNPTSFGGSVTKLLRRASNKFGKSSQ